MPAGEVGMTITAVPSGIDACLCAARYEAAVAEVTSTIPLATLLSTATPGLLLA